METTTTQRRHYSSQSVQPSYHQNNNNNISHYHHAGYRVVQAPQLNGGGVSQQNRSLHQQQPQQQHYHQLPVIVHGQHRQQQNGFDGHHHHQASGFSSSSSNAIIVVDPPRPPFIPKKPVYGGGAHPHLLAVPLPSSHSSNQIYAPSTITTTTTMNGHHHNHPPNSDFFDSENRMMIATGGGDQRRMVVSCDGASGTTTTYIGNGGGGLRRSTTPLPLAMGVSTENQGGAAATAGGISSEPIHHPPHPQFVIGNEDTSAGSSTTNSTFGSVRSNGTITERQVVVAEQPRTSSSDLHYSVSGVAVSSSSGAANGVYATTKIRNYQNNNKADKPPRQLPKRRPSLLGGVSTKMASDQHPPMVISSYGYSSEINNNNNEGRIYASAVYGHGQQLLATKKNSSESDQHQEGIRNGSGLRNGSIFGGSQLQISDGKSTLSRRAQKLAQKAVNKLTAGTLGSELSSSASALYSMFTAQSGPENGHANGAECHGGGIYAESASYLNGTNHRQQQEFYYGDKAPVVSAHTSRGIEFLERFGQFIKERAVIEEEYAAKLKNLAKRSRGKKADDEEAKMYTTVSAFQAMLGEVESFASQHEVIGERLRCELLPRMVEKCRDLRANRKQHSQNFEAMEKGLQARVEELWKQRKNYEKSHLDAQGAIVKYAKAEKNMNLSRLDLEKAKQNMHNKSTFCEQNKQGYAAQLATTNQAKYEHFNIALPALLESMRKLDVERIEFTKQAMLDSVKAETSVMNIIQRCYSDMNTAIGTISPERDTLALVEQTKTGYAHPQDFQFEDLGDPAAILQDGSESFDGSSSTMKRNSNGKAVNRKQSMKLFSSASNAAKNASTGSNGSAGAGASEYGTLPPQQRCRKIQQKLKELEDELRIKDQSQAGMQRMHGAYSANPKLGDPGEVAKQLQQNRQEMDTLQHQIDRFQKLLLDAQRELNQPLGAHHGSQQQLHNTTTSSSSPGSSPRGSAGSVAKLNNGQPPHYGKSDRLNGSDPRASYSEASSISSVDAAGTAILHHNNGPPPPPSIVGPPGPVATTTTSMVRVVHQQQPHNTASALSTSGFSTTSPSSVSPAQSQSRQQQQQQMPHIDSGSADFYEECDTPTASARGHQHQSDMVLGTALAIYAYDAAPDEVGGTTITMKEGDELLLLERDVGDGWTRVRHVASNAEGFVPSSYLDCKWYPTTDGPSSGGRT